MAGASPSSVLQRLLYRVYHRNSAFTHFFNLRVKPAGILLVLLIPASWVLLPHFSLGPIYQVRIIIFVLLGVGFLWMLCRNAHVYAERSLPRHATAHEKVNYTVRLRNEGAYRLSAASFTEIAPDNRPTLQQFIGTKEPGEDQRNPFDRAFAYYRWEWLQQSLSRFTSKPSAPIRSIAANQSTEIQLSLTPLRRGVIKLDDMRVNLADPFGIIQRCKKIQSRRDQLIVLPRRYSIPPMHLPGNARFQLGGEAASSGTGQSGDFTSIREYRPGDPLRHIHWKSWARTGKAIVKEYEEMFFPRYGLLLDTFAAPADAELFEQAVSIAASFAASIDTRESLLDLMFIHNTAHVFTAGRGEERVDKMLEVLAGVNCDPRPDYTALTQLALRYQDELTACICVFTQWSEERCEIVKRLHREGLNLKVISLCHQRRDAQALHQLLPSPVPVQWIRGSHMQQDLMMGLDAT